MNLDYRRPFQAGQVSVEYLIGCLIVLALLMTAAGGRASAFEMIVDAVRDGFARFAAALSMS
jgi:hypothetical protein